MFLRTFIVCVVAALPTVLITSQSDADVIVSKLFSGSGSFTDHGHSVTLSADALFKLDTTTEILTVLLSNTSPAADFKIGRAEILTEMFFNATNTLTPISATLPSGSLLVGTAGGQTLGGNWEYAATSHAASDLPNHVLSSDGLYVKHKHHAAAFGASTSHGFGRASWGLVNTSDHTGRGKLPVVDHEILFTFHADPRFSLDELGPSVVFQFGTKRSDPQLLGPDPPPPGSDTPEPGSLAIWSLLGVAGMVWRRRAV